MADRTERLKGLILQAGGRVVEHTPRECRSAFEIECRGVLNRVEQARCETLSFVDAYSDVNGGGLSEEQRDLFDVRVSSIIKEEQGKIDAVRESVASEGVAREGSLLAHKQAVVQYLYERLQGLTKLSSELQLLRMRQTLSSKKTLFDDGSLDTAAVEHLVEQDKQDGLRRRKTVQRQYDDFASEAETDEEMDKELQMELENEQVALKAQLDAEMQGVRQAEKQMREFSELAAVFSEKLMEQSESISTIFQDVQQSTVLMDKSKDQLDSAKQHNSSFRKYVIVFFSIMSGMLIFMDWMD